MEFEMKKLLQTGILLILLIYCLEGHAQVVIHEIGDNGKIELLNLNANEIDVTDWYLYNTPFDLRLGALESDCGSLMLASKEVIVVNTPTFYARTSGELALFSTNSFGNADALVDYVIWGNRAGNTIEDTAAAAGHWEAGERAPGFAQGQSLQHDRNGNSAINWAAAEPSLCEPVDPCLSVGGEIRFADDTAEKNICSGDGIADPFDIVLQGEAGEDFRWVITDTDSMILGLPDGLPIDLEGAPTGTCLVFNMSTIGRIDSLQIGSRFRDVAGCFELSNGLTIVREGANGGTIATEDGSDRISICIGEGLVDTIDISLDDQDGENQVWIISDTNGMILDLPFAPPFDLEGAGAAEWQIRSFSYNGEATGLEVGGRLDSIVTSCGDFSNPIIVLRNSGSEVSEGGSIVTADSLTTVSFCTNDGLADDVTVVLTDATGSNSAYIVTDTDGTLLAVQTTRIFDFEGVPTGTCFIWHISYDDGIDSLAAGLNVFELSGGCFDLSNAITVVRVGSLAGNLLTTDSLEVVNICAGDDNPDPFDVILSGQGGDASTWLFTTFDSIVIVVSVGPPFDFDRAGPGSCLVWHIAHQNNDRPILPPGSHLDSLIGCYGISNPIQVNRGPNGGSLLIRDSISQTTICAGDDISDAFVMQQSDTTGTNAAWIVTDTFGLILSLPLAQPIDLDGAGPGTCQIWHLRYEGDINGLVEGENVNDLAGCHHLSNPFTVIREDFAEGCESTATHTPALWDNIEVFPNPVQEAIFIENRTDKEYEYALYNVLGAQLLTGKLERRVQITELDVKALPAGLYQLRVGNQQQFSSRQILKL